MLGELERIVDKAVVAYFNVLLQHSVGSSEENHQTAQSG